MKWTERMYRETLRAESRVLNDELNQYRWNKNVNQNMDDRFFLRESPKPPSKALSTTKPANAGSASSDGAS